MYCCCKHVLVRNLMDISENTKIHTKKNHQITVCLQKATESEKVLMHAFILRIYRNSAK